MFLHNTKFCRLASGLAGGVRNLSGQKPKTAILMLNMGGPTHTDQVHDYLLRIMTDRDMIQLPVQSRLGPWIAQRRTPEVQKKYKEIGGGSPILKWTELQGQLMCEQLDRISPETAPHKHYVGFRYVNPLTENTLAEIEKDKPERVVLFSQYPQYSCATSGSSFNSIFTHYRSNNLPSDIKWSIIDRWGTHPLLIKTFAQRIRDELAKFVETKRNDVVILFTAHSLPLKAVNRGDAYPSEIGASVHMVMQELGQTNPYSLAWQSKVGPLPWLAPATDDAIKGYVKQGLKNFILVPIAFVNEHIETLHELDIEYCDELAKEVGVEEIRRAATPNDHPLFIDALTNVVADHLKSQQAVNPKFLMRCPMCSNPKCRESKSWYRQLCSN
uniref:Ferrochelatase, mitochondrial n=1 Tax=Drosophila melanogaster TaxID=7227 RepID=HEMH_DROME|nr:ferrochelatase, isoform A [Drosophila melanogaster]Q9V9S8.1 RecName: Full=Ferrochelatase, mitochondrial; AltName: Full=Heme synthase; AltName: Full=Protoheme ferro-lyase; Flags: Precursor [Drosophila melanogaster]AAF57206.1 ferrochelatase, isoform A [Drosophila melanogaster]|eukprot:NP_524613.1 ferrochelatase, isoform A [Drosophila melanogaster]